MAERTLTFAEHIQELRKRLMWSLFFVAIGAGLGYVLHNSLLIVLQRPLNQALYYTTPTGAFSFIIKVCTVFGIIVALPAVLYHGFAFFEPLIASRTRKKITLYVVLSVLLAAMGIGFAYFVSLPAALHFLVHFGSAGGITSLITANEYFNFVLAYIAGFAALFQLPLVITFINRVKPLTTQRLMSSTRYVVLASFVIAAIITPTPDPFNQLLMAGPIILLYFLSACFVVMVNWRSGRKARKLERLAEQAVPQMIPVPVEVLDDPLPEWVPPQPQPAAAPSSVHYTRRPTVQPVRPRREVVSDMVVAGRRATAPAYVPRARMAAPASQPVQAPIQPRPRPARGLITDFIPITE